MEVMRPAEVCRNISGMLLCCEEKTHSGMRELNTSKNGNYFVTGFGSACCKS